MSELLQCSSDSLCKVVRWAHSHGTICSLIPSLQHLSHASYGNVLAKETVSRGNGIAIAVWGCAAGHAYHWPLRCQDTGPGRSDINIQGQERFVVGRTSSKVAARGSCDLSCSELASEGEEFSSRLFDMTGCDSSATDEDGDYEPCLSRKRGGAPGGETGKKIKQETTAEDYYSIENMAANGLAKTDSAHTSQACLESQTPPQHTHTLLPQGHTQPLAAVGDQAGGIGCEGLVDPKMELLGPANCTTVTTEQPTGPSSMPGTVEQASARCLTTGTTDQTIGGGSQEELERLRALLRVERSRNDQMSETISSLKQDKELLQQELTKKAELICDFLHDQLRPEKRRPHSSNQMDPGSSQMTLSDDVASFNSPVLFDSFEEVELHPLDCHRTLKSKRSRDGENTRVRMKNVKGVIARYMAALQEFRRSVSMKVAFDRVGVDRNTISRTAAIAELSLAAPEVFHALAPWDEKEETLAHYAHRCRQAMDDNIKTKIKSMKARGDLLPIVSK